MGKKLSYQEVKEYIESYGCELLSEKYVNNEAKLRIKCKCGNIFEKSYINFKHVNCIVQILVCFYLRV